MKRFKIFAVLFVLFCGSFLYAKDFDWSDCWCNYGGGIEKGDFIVNLDAGLFYDDFIYTGYNKEEITTYINMLKTYNNIIIKYGRFRPNQKAHFGL